MAIRIFLNRPEHFDEFPEIEHQAMLDAWVEKQSILTIEHAYFDTLDDNPVIAIHPMYPNQIEDNTDTELLDDLIDDLAHNYSTMPRSFNEPTGLMTIQSALKIVLDLAEQNQLLPNSHSDAALIKEAAKQQRAINFIYALKDTLNMTAGE